jgi:hypothetical protein
MGTRPFGLVREQTLDCPRRRVGLLGECRPKPSLTGFRLALARFLLAPPVATRLDSETTGFLGS